MSRGKGLKMVRLLKRLDNVCDVGILAGTQERREAKALIRELRALAAQVNRMEIRFRIESRTVIVLTPGPAQGK